MARDWRRIGEAYLPDQPFVAAWDLYQHAARIIVDRAFAVSITSAGDTAPPGIISAEVAAMLGRAPEGAVEAAKAHMAFALGTTAFLEDMKDYGLHGIALRALLEEAEPAG